MNTLQRIKQAIVDNDQSAAEQALLDHVKPYVDCLKATYLFERNEEVKERIEKLIAPELREKSPELIVGRPYRVIGKSTGGFSFQETTSQMLRSGIKYLTCKKDGSGGSYLFEDDRKILSIYLMPEDVVEYELTAEDLVVGGKYVPVKKSIWGDLDESDVWRCAKAKNQPYLYYTGLDDNMHVFDDEPFKNIVNGDFFLPSDVKPYYEN